jgi:hypothetical protein
LAFWNLTSQTEGEGQREHEPDHEEDRGEADEG